VRRPRSGRQARPEPQQSPSPPQPVLARAQRRRAADLEPPTGATCGGTVHVARSQKHERTVGLAVAARSRTGGAVPSKPSTDPTVRAVCGSGWEIYLVLAVDSETWRLAKAVEGEASSTTQRLRWAAVVAWDAPDRQPVKPAVRPSGRPEQRKVDDSNRRLTFGHFGVKVLERKNTRRIIFT
jgi:hypothetical protein